MMMKPMKTKVICSNPLLQLVLFQDKGECLLTGLMEFGYRLAER
nr:hypothetical protein Iba_scaffold24013CG0400 [Ipomoea batatas]